MAPPVTLSGILPDLYVHCPKLKGRSKIKRWQAILLTALVSSGFHMMVCFRFGAFFHKSRLLLLSLLVEKFIFHWYGSVIPCRAQMGPGIWAPHPMGIVLSSNARLGERIVLRQNVEIVQVWEKDRGRSGIVGDRVVLNSGCILLNGAVVENDAVVAARAVVTKRVPTGHMAMGSPASFKPLREDQVFPISPLWT